MPGRLRRNPHYDPRKMGAAGQPPPSTDQILSMHVRVSEPCHRACKFNNAGPELLVLKGDVRAAAVACHVRMVEKISEWLELSCTAGSANDFDRHFIWIFFHLDLASGDSSAWIIACVTSAERVRRQSSPSFSDFSVPILWKAHFCNSRSAKWPRYTELDNGGPPLQ